MSKPVEGTETALKDHLLQVYKSTGIKPKQLADQPEFPKELYYIWEAYLQLRRPEGITYTEIKSWSQLTCCDLLAWEVDTIKTLERVHVKVSEDG